MDVSATTAESWWESLELCKDYDLKDTWSMDENSCFFKALAALPTKGLTKEGKKTKGGKGSRQCMTVAFPVSADGGKVDKPMVYWKRKKKIPPSKCN